MKKNIIMLLAAALFVVAGCKKDDNKTDNGEKMTFTSYLGNGGAKTEIDGKDMKWTEDDKIVINDETFTSEISEGGTFATFTGNVVEPPFNAYYPASICQSGLALPATQTYNGTNLSGVNPMYARSENTTLVFHNICALVKLGLTGTCSVASIEAKADQPLSGAFNIAGGEATGYYAQLTSKDPAATVILNCGNPGIQLNATIPTTFYIALPKGEYTNLTFTVSDIDGNTADVKQEGIAMLKAGSLWNKEAKVSFPFTFTVAKGKKVEFAPGNLYWDGSAFKFEADQWRFEDSWNTSHVSHFLWSPDKDVAVGTSTSVSGSTSDVFFTNATQTTANPGFQVAGETAGTWRTLSKDEWNYLLNSRTNASSLRAWKDFGNNVKGLVILPDGTKKPSEVLDSIISVSDLATYGAVFLPAAGYRFGAGVNEVGSHGYYWSSTPHGDNEGRAYRMYFVSTGYVGAGNEHRYNGYAVRLVR